MSRKYEPRPLHGKTSDTPRNVVARDVRMNDVYIVLADEVCDLHRAQNPKRVSDRNVEDVLGREKIQAVLPIAGRSERNEYFMAASMQAPAEVDDVTLRSAVVPRR